MANNDKKESNEMVNKEGLFEATGLAELVAKILEEDQAQLAEVEVSELSEGM